MLLSLSMLPTCLSGPSVLCSAPNHPACQAWEGVCVKTAGLGISHGRVTREPGQWAPTLSRVSWALGCPQGYHLAQMQVKQAGVQGAGHPLINPALSPVHRSCTPNTSMVLCFHFHYCYQACVGGHAWLNTQRHTDMCMPTYTFSSMIIQL